MTTQQKTKLLVVAGPTASGKTALSVALAKALGGEIVSADSMQLYKGMDIGTAKASAEERQGIPHHLLDILAPNEPYSAAKFKEDASACIDDITGRGKLPVIVGGTGLYIDALLYPYAFRGAESDPAIRAELEAFVAEKGESALHERLAALDPEAAQSIHPNNVRRVIRAVEVCLCTGEKYSKQEKTIKNADNCLYDAAYLGLEWPRELLYRRIDQRVEAMFEQGLVEETTRLLGEGLSPMAQSMQAIGYKEILPYINGEATLEAVMKTLKLNTRHYAKRQMTWFKANPMIRWLDATQPPDLLCKCAMEYCQGKD